MANIESEHAIPAAPFKSIYKPPTTQSTGETKQPDFKQQASVDAASSIRFNVPTVSTASVSTLTSLSESVENKIRDSTAVHPSANLEFLRNVHKRTKRKRQLRNCIRVFHAIVAYGLPTGGVILGITGITLGHFLSIESLFVAGCLLLIAAFGLILQFCFWSRSSPNKFRAKEIPFNMPHDDSLISKTNEHSDEDGVPPQSAVSINSGDNSIKSPGVNPAQVRRLSMALNRVTAELSAARQITTRTGGGGVLNLARRLTMTPMNFGVYMDSRDVESGNGWVAGRAPHGIRRGLAWNDTGAARFYASNYDWSGMRRIIYIVHIKFDTIY